MHKEEYLIAVDLDDTSLQNLYSLNEGTEKALKKMAAMGHKVMIATARPACLTLPHYQKLGLNTLVALCNGADLLNFSDDSFKLRKKYIGASEVEKIFEIIPLDIVESFHMQNNDELYLLGDFKGSTYFEELIKQSKVEHIDLHSIPIVETGRLFFRLKDISDADIIVNRLSEIKTINVYSRRWISDTAQLNISISSIFADKWYSVKEAADFYGIAKENIITFGDEFNDYMMLKKAGHGFAMLNGNEELKKEIGKVTRYTNTDSGVGRELDRMFNLDLFDDLQGEKVV